MISHSDKKIYTFLSAGLIAGIIWLAFQFGKNGMATPKGTACLFNRVTHLPCPSCGTTRAAVACLHGDISGGLLTNPAGLLILIFMASLALLFLIDIFSPKRVVPTVYRLTEKAVSRKPLSWILITLVLANWCWNILKGL